MKLPDSQSRLAARDPDGTRPVIMHRCFVDGFDVDVHGTRALD
jgi:hypothetical protein